MARESVTGIVRSRESLEIRKEGLTQHRKEHCDETDIRFVEDPVMVRRTGLCFRRLVGILPTVLDRPPHNRPWFT